MRKWLLRVLIIAVLLVMFKNWILPGVISSGDFGYYSGQHVEDIKFLGVWDPTLGGMGASVLSSLWFKAYSSFVVKFSLLLGWNNYIHIFWYFPYIIFSFLSATFLFKTLFKDNFLNWVAGFIYTANTYSLMVVAGGQMGVALAYSIAPLILASFIKLVDRSVSQPFNVKYPMSNIQYPMIAGLLFSVLVMLDLRLAYIMIIGIGLYMIINIQCQISNVKYPMQHLRQFLLQILFILGIPLGITGLLHAYWLLPAVLSGGSTVEQLGDIYTSSESVKFFSFAKLENAISLLHPNWPENIFGKVGFMKSEFLLLPILAFMSLLFVKKETKENRMTLLFFALLGLVGTSLAKGANDPFGFIYIWLFENVPGFVMFRDPTKWYLLTAISYSVLIPFSVYSIYQWLSKTKQFSIFSLKFSIDSKIFNLQNAFTLLLISYFLYLVHPALFGQLGGTFGRVEVPGEYATLERYLSSQTGFFRTLWVPAPQRFGFYSNLHPAIPARVFFNTTDNPKILKNFANDKTKQLLVDSGVKYIIVPYDSQGEIFLEDRKYDERQYISMVKRLQNVTWLREIDGFGRIKVFEVDSPKDHFWTPSKSMDISYEYIDPTKYSVSVTSARKGDKLVFAESYDKNWIINCELPISDCRFKKINSQKLAISNQQSINSFILPEDGSYTLEVYYAPQKWVDMGVGISLVTLVLVGGSLVVLRKKG